MTHTNGNKSLTPGGGGAQFSPRVCDKSHPLSPVVEPPIRVRRTPSTASRVRSGVVFLRAFSDRGCPRGAKTAPWDSRVSPLYGSYLRLDGAELAETAAEVAQAALDAGGVAEKEARHEAEDRVVDLAILGDAHDAAFGYGGDVDGPGAAKGQVLFGHPGDASPGHLILDQFVGDLVDVRVLLPPPFAAVAVGQAAGGFDVAAPIHRPREREVDGFGFLPVAGLSGGAMMAREQGTNQRDDGEEEHDSRADQVHPFHAAPLPKANVSRDFTGSLGKQQLPHIGGLTIHRDGDHQLATPLEPSGQSHVHLVESGVGALWSGIRHAGVDEIGRANV